MNIIHFVLASVLIILPNHEIHVLAHPYNTQVECEVALKTVTEELKTQVPEGTNIQGSCTPLALDRGQEASLTLHNNDAGVTLNNKVA